MNKQEFIELFVEELEIEDVVVTEDTRFEEIEEWNSMGHMIAIALISDNFNVKVTGNELKEMLTIKSLIEKIGVEKFAE